MRLELVARILGPFGAWWLRERVVGIVPILENHQLLGASVDGDRVAGASLRVMGTAIATGQAAGIAAAQFAAQGSAVAGDIRRALAAQGALLDGENLPGPVAIEA